ncbi:MAG: hypothetical protein DWQ10_07675 [Calditrichaeota bacterium]|nr:MAG: hypothetical protein DWQ10_07675 [Calditrichota bacterium]
MNNLLYIFVIIILLKLLFNISKYIQCKRYLKKYLDWLENQTWRMTEYKSRVIKLLKDAEVKDSYVGFAEPLGLGQIQTGSLSVMSNFPNAREDIVSLMLTMFHQAIGVYRSRIKDSFNPLYWIEFVLTLPKQVFGYLGIPAESLITKIVQLLYWIIAAVTSILFALYKPEIGKLVREWLKKVIQ